METVQVKPNQNQTIKKIGQAIIAVSAMIIFSNGMGLLSFTLMGFNSMSNSSSPDFSILGWIFGHYSELCLSMVIIGISFLFGGIFLTKYKFWAIRLLTIISGLLIIVIWTLMIVFTVTINKNITEKIISIMPIITAIIFSTPFVLLIRYLNKKTTLELFKNQD